MSKKKGRKLDGVAEGSQRTASPISASSLPQAKKAKAAEWRWLLMLGSIVALVVVVLYANTLWMGTVFNDNATFQQLKLRDPATYFSALWLDAAMRPLTEPWTKASYALDLLNYRSAFGWYHFVNIFLHLSACLALFALIFRLGRYWQLAGRSQLDPYRLALVGAVLYACHPLAAEPVTYISGRYAILSAANFLLSLNFLVSAVLARGVTGRVLGYGLAAAFAVMCLESGQFGLMLPLTMLGLMFLLKPDNIKPLTWMIRRPILSGILLAFALALPFVWLNGVAAGAAPNSFGTAQLDPMAYVATQGKAFATYYTRCFFIPLGLSIDPPYSTATGFADPFSLLGLLMLIALAGCLYVFRQQPVLLVGIGLVLAGYVPHLFLVQQERVADPVFYLSLAGLCTIAAWFMVQLLSGPVKEAAIKFALVVVVLSGLTIWRNLDFSADERLLASTLKTNSNSTQALTVSAMENYKKKDFKEALDMADQALLVEPNLTLGHLSKGYALSGLKRYDEAQRHLTAAVDLAQKQHLPILNDCKLALAENYIHQHKPFEVGALVYPSLTGNPDNAKALYLLGMAAYERHGYPEAYMYLSRAAQSGSAESLIPLSDTALRTNNQAVAFKLATLAKEKFDTPESQLAYGAAALATDQLELAGKALQAALKASPDSAQAMALLSILYQKKNDKVLSESYRKDALSANPDVFSELALGDEPASTTKSAPVRAGQSPAGRKRHR